MLAQQRRETPADIRQRIEGPALIAGHHPCRLPQPPQAVLRHRRQFVDALMDQMMIPVEDLETAQQTRLGALKGGEIMLILDPVMTVQPGQKPGDIALQGGGAVMARLLI